MWRMGVSLFFASGLASAAELSVEQDGSGQYTTIQSALNEALPGDVIHVGPGTYTEALWMDAVPIELRSSEGAENTIVDASGWAAAITFSEGVGEDTVVEGFTLVNPLGRGLIIRQGSPTLIGLAMEGLGSSELDGGAVWIQGGAPRFESCEFRENIGARGGAVFVEDAELRLVDCSFDENEAEEGGAIYGERVFLSDIAGEYDFNVSTESGGAVRLNGPFDASFDSGRFWSNFTSANGGAVASYGEGDRLDFRDVSFISNESHYNGGAVSAEYFYSTVLFDSCHLDSNDGVYDYGAGIYAAYYTGVSLNDTVVENHLAAYQGGGVYQYYGGDFICRDSLFEDNHAGTVGGGARLRDFYSYGTVAVDGCSFQENVAQYEGGGLAIEDTNIVTIENANFLGNEAGGNFPGGGLVLLRSDEVRLGNNHFVSNTAGFGGGAVLEESDPLLGPYVLTNNLFVENVASYGGGLMLTESPRPRGEVDYGGIWSNQSASINRFVLKEDPSAPQGDWVASMEWDFTAVTDNDVKTVFYTPTIELPELMPTLFRLNLFSPHTDWGFTFRFRDQEGEYFYGWYGDVNWTGWREIEVGGVESWGSWGGDDDDIIDLPIRELQFEVYSDAGFSGVVSVDNVRMDTESDGEVFLTGFEQSGWPLVVHNNSFLANYGLKEGAAILAWDAVADFRNNLVVESGGSLGIEVMDANSQMDWSLSHNGFFRNEYGHLTEGVEGSESIEDDPRMALYSQDGKLENDRLVFLDGSPYRDAGDPDIIDPDGSRSDLGANGGPGARWVDEDLDGYSTGYDCDDKNPSVHPGAEDAPYDGINQDCSWGSDFDQDGDGEDAEGHGGSDCDDTDASVQSSCNEESDAAPSPVQEASSDCGCSSSSAGGSRHVPVGLLMFATLLVRRTRSRKA
ncbi:MAG: hypothetical protein VXW32_11995 [Myxococcota bacterium]|nr:hypothetical protein [Myxococcota bacterium]